MKWWSAFCVVVAVFALTRIFMFHTGPTAAEYETAKLRIGTQTVHVRVPLTTAASEQGLGGVTSLTDAEGMWWNFSAPQQPTFWMQGMKIDLDFIWVRDGVITELTEHVAAPTSPTATLPLYRPEEPVTNVLEVASGFIERHNIRVGMPVTIN